MVTGLTAPPTLNYPVSSTGNARAGVINVFKLGPLTIHHLGVLVVPDGYAGAGVVVGLPILARFKQVTFTDSSIIVSESATPCKHPLPQTFASPETDQHGHLVFGANVGGKPARGSFDSGSNALLVAEHELSHRFSNPLHKVGPLRYRGYMAAHVAQGQIQSYGTVFLPNVHAAAAFLIGAPVVATATVRLAFSPPSICFLPARDGTKPVSSVRSMAPSHTSSAAR